MNDAPVSAAAPSEAKKVKLSSSEPAPLKSLLPPSTFLFRGNRPVDGSMEATRPPIETDVGIFEYVGRDIAPFQGIIKQRSVDSSFILVQEASVGCLCVLLERSPVELTSSVPKESQGGH